MVVSLKSSAVTSAHAQQDRGTDRVAMHAEDQLGTALRHLLHQEAPRTQAGARLDLVSHRIKAGVDLLGRQVDGQAADVALVRDPFERIFSTTRPPSCCAARCASSVEWTTISRAQGTPERENSCLACVSFSEPVGRSRTGTGSA